MTGNRAETGGGGALATSGLEKQRYPPNSDWQLGTCDGEGREGLWGGPMSHTGCHCSGQAFEAAGSVCIHSHRILDQAVKSGED